MAEYKSSILFSLKDLASSGIAKINKNLNALKMTTDKSGKSFSDYWHQFNNESAYSQTAANLYLASQGVSQFASSIRSVTELPTQLASSFQTGMARVNTVLNSTNAIGGDTTKTLHVIEQAARQTSGGLNQAGKLASIGMEAFSHSVYTMLSSGLKTEQAIAATNQSALLAKATGGSMQEAAAAITGVFNNLGNKTAEAGAEMTRLSDIIAGTQNYFAFENLSQFTSGLKNVSGIANSAGIPLTQLSAAIGQLNTNMITGPEAGTALKTVIAQLGNASKRLGFDVANTADGGLDLINTLKNIHAVGANTDQLIKGFGTEAGPAVALLTSNLDALQAGYKAVGDSAGITLANASKMADTFASRQKLLNDTWSVYAQRLGVGSMGVKNFGVNVGIATGKVLNAVSQWPGGEIFTGFVGGALEVTGSITGVIAKSFQFTAGLNSMFALMQKRHAVWGMMKTGMNFFKSGILKTIPSLAEFGKGIFVMGKSLLTLNPLQAINNGLTTIWNALLNANPIGLIVIGIVALIGVTILVIKHWNSILPLLHKVGGMFKMVGLAIWNVAKYTVPIIAIPNLIIQHWQPIKTFFVGLWDGISTGITNFINIIKNPINSIINMLEPLFQVFDNLGGKLWGKITGAIPSIDVAGARADGGTVLGGHAYKINEKGQEFFIPSQNGTIIPHHQLTPPPSGNTTTVHIEHVHLKAPHDLSHFVALIKEFTQEVGYAHA